MPDPYWAELFQFVVAGEPKGQPRPRATVMYVGGKARARMYHDDSADGWKAQVAAAARPFRPRVPLSGPLRVDLTLWMSRPKYMAGRRWPDGPVPHVARPDVDNIAKGVWDALTDAGMWRDDAQIAGGTIEKWYAAKGGRPGAVVRVSRWVG